MFSDTNVQAELSQLAAALHITASEIHFRGKTYAIQPDNAQQTLANVLYSECYALKASAQSSNQPRPSHAIGADPEFVAQLSKANQTPRRTENGWKCTEKYGNGYVQVSKDDKTLTVPMAVLIPSVAGKAAAIGDLFSLVFPNEDRDGQPAFYYAFGTSTIDATQGLTRVYVNITNEGAAALVKSVAARLNFYRVPFLFKCLNRPALYFRRDPAVLYVDNRDWPFVERILPQIRTDIASYLEDDVPLFAYRFSPGIGIAESPNLQESFGMHRARILAKALLTASNSASTEEKIKEIAAVFSQNGIHPETTFLNKGSKTL